MAGNTKVPPDTGYPEPGGRAPAPPWLRLAQVFVNTADREGATDVFETPRHLADWLTEHGLVDDHTDAVPDDLALAIDLREGMRALFLTHCNDIQPDTAGLQRLEYALARLPLMLTTTGTTIDLVPAATTPVRTALATIAAVLVTAGRDQLTRLKACRRDPCQWVFYDASRNRQSSWCSMSICGTRTKMRTYRARRIRCDG